ncbi:MAG: DUF4895 domain-containing protein [Candidatus Calescibacterium sp.]|nr:DUF4895 domain-containing protein [Candidatus Calescibacterium sp.]MCX7733667.1 DUF4895 domain-containing protein [bacterium]
MRIKNPIKKASEKILGSDKELEKNAEGKKIHQEEIKEYDKQVDKEIYDEFRKLLLKLPSIGGTILNILAEKGVNLPKMFVQMTSTVIREEIKNFLSSIDVVGLVKKVLLDTAVELRIEVAFKDKSQEGKIERKIMKRELKIKKKK